MSEGPEFSRLVDVRSITAQPLRLEADAQECAALARRFALVSIGRLEAEVTLAVNGTAVTASGTLHADLVQSCAVSGEDLPVTIREKLALVFVPESALAAPSPDEEVELEADELDQIPYAGTQFDLGEALAQSLALAIDPFAVGPNADAARKKHGLLEEGATGPLADALRDLTGKA